MKFSWTVCGVAAVAIAASVATLPAADSKDTVPANPTFTKDVLPIFQKSCQDCHRPGQMAPFSLINKENPDPTAFIGWGDRTVDEMNIGWLDFYYISDEEFAALQKEKTAKHTTERQ